MGLRTCRSGDRRRRAQIVAVALLVAPGLASASPTSPATPELEQAAIAHDEAGRHDEAAKLFEKVALAADDADARSTAYLDAFGAWQAAFAATGERAHHCAARELLERAQGDERLDPRARASFYEMAVELDAKAIECDQADPRPVPLLAPDAPLSRPPSTPTPVDAPRRSPLTIAGAVTLAVAAPALGGTIYTLAIDRQLYQDARERRAKWRETGEVDEAELNRLEGEARINQRWAIGLGATTAVLVTTGVGLLVARRGRGSTSSLSLLPQARADLGGVVLSGRF